MIMIKKAKQFVVFYSDKQGDERKWFYCFLCVEKKKDMLKQALQRLGKGSLNLSSAPAQTYLLLHPRYHFILSLYIVTPSAFTMCSCLQIIVVYDEPANSRPTNFPFLSTALPLSPGLLKLPPTTII